MLLQQRLVHPFFNSILLLCVSNCTMAHNSFIFVRLIKHIGIELHSVVDPKTLHLPFYLLFNNNLALLEGHKYIAQMLEKIHLNFSQTIINHQLKSKDNELHLLVKPMRELKHLNGCSQRCLQSCKHLYQKKLHVVNTVFTKVKLFHFLVKKQTLLTQHIVPSNSHTQTIYVTDMWYLSVSLLTITQWQHVQDFKYRISGSYRMKVFHIGYRGRYRGNARISDVNIEHYI